MLRSVFEIKSAQLTCQSNRRIHWWSTKRWSGVINVTPPVSDVSPLWLRDNNNLATVTLFGSTPKQLQLKLQQYWAKPAWLRWLLRCFTLITQQLEVCSYYQQCLAFRDIYATYLDAQPSTIDLSLKPKQMLLEILGNWFIILDEQFESNFSRQSAQWFTQYFEREITRHEQWRRREFLSYLIKQLKKTAPEKKISLKEINKEYDNLEKIIRAYLTMWGQHMFLPTPSAPVTERRMVPAVASTDKKKVISDVIKIEYDKDLNTLCSVDSWVKRSRVQLNDLLANKQPDSAKQFAFFFENKLALFKSHIEPQLQHNRSIVNEVLYGNLACQLAWEDITDRQMRLIKAFKQAVLLFHPDRNRDLIQTDKTLETCWNGIFHEFKHCWDSNESELAHQLDQLKAYSDTHWDIRDQLNELRESYRELRAMCEALALERKQFREEMEAKQKAMAEEMEERAKEREAKLKKEMEARANEQEAKLEAMAEKMEARLDKNQAKIDEVGQGIKQLQKLIEPSAFFKSRPTGALLTPALEEPVQEKTIELK